MILVTGAAGFIGASVAEALLARGETVHGIDNLNDYYDVRLKQTRLDRLSKNKAFYFHKLDISNRDEILALARKLPQTTGIIHMAAQAGVRYSLEDPYAYVQSNVMGQVVIFELARMLKDLKHVVYASSSSVYGANVKTPFSTDDAVNAPTSLYGATKRADELIGHTYSRLYGIPSTGLRFFTVYGPWGRPDMAYYAFTRAILNGEPIHVFNRGNMWRDFTYIDDIVNGILRALDRPAKGSPPHALYNLGNCKSEKLTDFIAAIESAIGRRATVILEPMQPGDVVATHADIEASRRDLGFDPVTPMRQGIEKFVSWYRQYHNV